MGDVIQATVVRYYFRDNVSLVELGCTIMMA
jgi:hypothetical protein